MQIPIYPMKTLRFSSIDTGAHKICREGKPSDKPVDLVGKDSGKDWFYAPCDVICLKKYNKASNGLWFRSVDKVLMPTKKDNEYEEKYLYFMVEHMSVEGFTVGKKYTQGTKLFTENKIGNASGNHLHCSFGISDTKHTSKSMGSGWCSNSKGAWVLNIPKVTNVEINKCLWLDKSFTTSIKDDRLTFMKIVK